MLEQFILGIVQGIAEWLPVSSEGVIFLVKANFFDMQDGVSDVIREALFLHFGTFLAALVYFRKDVVELFKTMFSFKTAKTEEKKIFLFLLISTLISGVLGYIFVKIIDENNNIIHNTADTITLLVGCFLLITAYLQFKQKNGEGLKGFNEIKRSDGVILGLTQAFSAMPGLSRSGLTVSVLFMRNFNQQTALKLSFLMSLPIVLGGNIILNLDKFTFNPAGLIGVFTAFIFGLVTIKLLLNFAERVNFSFFVFGIAILTILSVLL